MLLELLQQIQLRRLINAVIMVTSQQRLELQVFHGNYSSESNPITNCINKGTITSYTDSATGIKWYSACSCYNCYNSGGIIAGVSDNLYGAGRDMRIWIL